MIRHIFLISSLFSLPGMGIANTYTDSPGTGQLSYSFFNLTPHTLNIEPYGALPNPHAYYSPARYHGLNAGESPATPGTAYPTNLFNPLKFDTPKGGDCDVSSGNQFWWVTNNYIFFNEQADPIEDKKGYSECGSKAEDAYHFQEADYVLIDPGVDRHLCRKSNDFILKKSGDFRHRPAIADTYWLSLDDGTSSGILLAGMASSTNMLIGGDPEGHVSKGQAGQNYPWCASWGLNATAIRNYAINPLAPVDGRVFRALSWNEVDEAWSANKDYTDTQWSDYLDNHTFPGSRPCSAYDATSYKNFVANNWGAGVVNPDFAQNLNPEGDGVHGGVWFGAEVRNANESANLVLNNAMVPINLSMYSDPWATFSYEEDEIYNRVLLEYGALYTRNYGAHYTLAIGDPYLINSFAAKTLWYLATSNKFAFQNDGLSEAKLNDLKDLLIPRDPAVDGLFYAGSRARDYLAWLLQAPKQAVNAYNQTVYAASQGTNKKVATWKKVAFKAFKTAANIGLTYGFSAANVKYKAGTNAGVQGTIKTIDTYSRKYVVNPFFNCLSGGCSSNSSATVPQSATSQAVINDTYSAGGLLSSLLANVVVQAEFNNQQDNPNYKLPIFSNYSINYDEGRCRPGSDGMTSVDINGNFISANCYRSANGTGSTVNNSDINAPTDYINVLSTYPTSVSKTDKMINLWSAILNNADITTNEDASHPERNGYMELANAQSTFTPPTQLVDLPVLRGESVSNPVVNVNVAFNQATGLLSVSSYTVRSGPYASQQYQTPPSATPQVSLQIGNQPPPAGYGIDVAIYDSFIHYYPNSGILTVTGYKGTDSSLGGTWKVYSMNTLTLDVRTCAQDSEVVLQLDFPEGYVTAVGGKGSLYCTKNVVITPNDQSPPTEQPGFLTVNVGDTTNPITDPDEINYDASTGKLTVSSYKIANGTASFINGPQEIDLTQCDSNSAVTMTIVPTDDKGEGSYGFLSCQNPPSISYNTCTRDPWATGGVVVAVTQSPDEQGNGATFELACSCMPDYLGGASMSYSYKLDEELSDDKNVSVGATSYGRNYGIESGYSGNLSDPGPGRYCSTI